MKADAELSNLKCDKAKPKAKPYRISDRGGLALLVTPEGGKLWRWRYRFIGVAQQMALGKYPDTSLADARLRHAEARSHIGAARTRDTSPAAISNRAS